MDLLALIFFIILGVIAIIAIMYDPFIGLYVFTIMFYLKPGIFNPIFDVIHLTRVVALLTFLVFLFQLKNKKSVKLFKESQTKWLVTLFVVMCFSVTTSIWKSHTVDSVLNFAKVFVAYILIVNLTFSLKRYRALTWSMILSALYIAIVSIQYYYQSGAVYSGARMSGAFHGALFGDPNDLALGLIMLIPFAYYDLFRGKGFFRKACLLVIIGIFFWGIMLSQSRGGLLAFCVMLFFMWIKSKKKIVALLIFILILVAGWQIAPKNYKARMSTIETASENDAAAISRLNAWNAGINMMKSRFFGVGVGNFGEAFVHYRPADAIDVPGERRVAHNMFIEIGGENGLIGLVIFVMMLISTFVCLNRTKKLGLKFNDKLGKEIVLLSNATFVSLAGYCAAGMFLSQGYNWILYYLVAFSVVLWKFVNGKHQENGQ